MARISTYPLDTGIVITDKLLGSDENDSSTKNFQIGNLTTYFNFIEIIINQSLLVIE